MSSAGEEKSSSADLLRVSSFSQMTRFENQTFEYFGDRSTGRVFSDLEFINCVFSRAGFSSITIPNEEKLDLVGLRSVARNLKFSNCCIEGVGFVGAGIVEDCIIDGLRVTKHLQTAGTAFRHVIIKGVVDRLMITPYVDFFKRAPEVQRSFDAANLEYYETVDWALDISGAIFKDCDIRGVPARLIRRDPETQVVLTREKALIGNWRDLDLSNTHWPTAIEFFLSDGYQDCVLAAPKRSRNFSKLLDGLHRLREAEIVELD